MNVALDNKYDKYASLAELYRRLFDAEVKSFKTFINTEDAWGEEFSPYSNINEFLFRL
jgi:hypothetical protein